MRIGYLECFSGISGDMLLGALVDAGVPFDVLAETAAALNVGARLEMRKVRPRRAGGDQSGRDHAKSREQGTGDKGHRRGAGAFDTHTRTQNRTHDSHSHSHECARSRTRTRLSTRHSRACAASVVVDDSRDHSGRAADGTVKQRAARAFQLLGEAEAAIHSIPIEKVHFHEVGAVDTIVDIVCAAAGCEALGVDRWMASPLNVGSGTVKCQHGTLPVPAPATLALLGDAPVYAAGPAMERVTPTGAALLRMLDVEYGPLPAMRVAARGYGAGGRDTPGEPNLLRLLVGEATDGAASRHGIDRGH